MANEPFDPGADRQALMSVKAAPKQQSTHTRRDTLETCLTIPRLGVWLRLASRAWPMLCGREESRGREREREEENLQEEECKSSLHPTATTPFLLARLHVCISKAPAGGHLPIQDFQASQLVKG